MTVTQTQINKARPLKDYKKGLKITVSDKMQKNYHYVLSENAGKNLAFKPELTPLKMLQMGIMDGKYLRDCYKEFPREWFEKGKFAEGRDADPNINYFKITSRLTLQDWQRRGWIPIRKGDMDIRGWFQWYCRYWIGRRDPTVDEVQIKRYEAIKRHKGQIVKACKHDKTKKGVCKEIMQCRPKQRQTLLNWAHNPLF
jgi:hypothetical protein